MKCEYGIKLYLIAILCVISTILVTISANHISPKQNTSFQGCTLNVTNKTNGAQIAVLLDYKYTKLQLTVPHRGEIKLQKHEKLIFLCPGYKNSVSNLHSPSIEADCEQKNILKINQTYYSFENLLCTKSVSADLLETQTNCGDDGKLQLIGYQMPVWTTDNFIPLITLCYDQNQGRTLFAYYTIHGEEIKFAIKSTSRRSFRTQGIGPKIAASLAYQKRYQKSTFNSLLGSALLAERYINESSYLSTGHLSPHADFLLASSQRATYFYVNACPQWQIINNGNWKSVENTIRKTVEYYNTTFTIITGTHGILQLENVQNNLVDIFLQKDKKIPVPKYVWKILYDGYTKKGIVFISLNNPFITNVTRIEFCNDICSYYNWERRTWKDPVRGYIFCCNITEFYQTVSSIPRLNVIGVLPGIM